MTIKLTYAQLNADNLLDSLIKLSKEKLPVKVAYNVQRVMRQLEKEIQHGRELYQKILKDTCELDEKGELIPQLSREVKKEDGTVVPGVPMPGSFTIKDPEAFEMKTKEFMELEIEIKSWYLKLDDFGDVKLTPVELMGLEPLISELEIVE